MSRRALLPASETQFFEADTIKCPPWLTVADILRCPHRKIDFPRRARKKARLLKKQAQLPTHLSPYTLLVYIYIARVSFTHSPPPLGAPSPSPPTPLPLPHLSPSPSPDPAASLRRHLLPPAATPHLLLPTFGGGAQSPSYLRRGRRRSRQRGRRWPSGISSLRQILAAQLRAVPGADRLSPWRRRRRGSRWWISPRRRRPPPPCARRWPWW